MKANSERTKHCLLCDHKTFNFTEGTKCGLTNQYPNFGHKCNSIKWGQNLQHEIKDINTEVFKTREKRNKVFIKLTFSILGGTALLIFSFKMAGLLYGVDHSIFNIHGASDLFRLPLIIFYLSTVVYGYGFPSFIRYLQEYNVNKKKKENLDQLLAIYNKEYTINIQPPKDKYEINYESDVKMF
ncbi:hypothetical protein [Flammeovirga pacifica]|uniref:Uncharacterized protein n=1 Tax=Flammeovirga pacifica TaxID=915059 RepID=A0A1S1Z4K1_FLAPC|nr:hypothetical protein [Flammeovirga pacifica]OHX68216.1 hypothetical protein NH26_18610 [Flammeovirga pacifica]